MDKARGSFGLDREQIAALALAPLLLLVVIGARWAPWHSVATVDERTYLEMAMGVWESGVPRFENGDVQQFPELQARWNVADGGQLWGSLSPGMAYLAAPVQGLGGISAVIRGNIVLIAVLALGVFALGREISGDPILGVGAVYLAVAASPVWAASFGFLPYSAAITLAVWTVFFASRAAGARGRPWHSVIAGLLGGLSIFFHLLVLPISLTALATLVWQRRRGGMWVLLGFLPCAVAAASINGRRFGSWNPISDGPCAWHGCPEGADPQSIGGQIAGSWMVLTWLVAVLLALWAIRRSQRKDMESAVLAALIGLGLLLGPLRSSLGEHLLFAWGLLADLTPFDLGYGFERPERGPGVLLSGVATKSLLQGSPYFVLALLGWRAMPEVRRAAGLPVLALFGTLVLRAGMDLDFAFGHPFVSIRYWVPAIPLLAIAAAVGIRDVGWSKAATAIAGGVGVFLAALLAGSVDDLALGRRVLILRVTLAAALVLGAAIAYRGLRKGRSARLACRWAAVIAIGLSVGITLGVDLPARVRFRWQADQFADRIARSVPQRSALIAFPDQLDASLSLLPSRDLEYLDLKEVREPKRLWDVVEAWELEGRPTLGVLLQDGVELLEQAGLVLQVIDADASAYAIRLPRPRLFESERETEVDAESLEAVPEPVGDSDPGQSHSP